MRPSTSSLSVLREVTPLRPPDRLALAVDAHHLKARIQGYRLAANELLDRAEALERELAEKEDLCEAIRMADKELERPWTRRRGRVM